MSIPVSQVVQPLPRVGGAILERDGAPLYALRFITCVCISGCVLFKILPVAVTIVELLLLFV